MLYLPSFNYIEEEQKHRSSSMRWINFNWSIRLPIDIYTLSDELTMDESNASLDIQGESNSEARGFSCFKEKLEFWLAVPC